MKSFSAKIYKIGINPYVLIPVAVLNKLFRQAGKNKGPIPIKVTFNGKEFIQTLVKYSGQWRLYLNTPMRKATGVDVGDMVTTEIEFDPVPRSIPIHPKLQQALTENKSAATAFKNLAPYRQKEIARYISFLKTEESLKRNLEKVIQYLLSNEPFLGRARPL